MSALLFFDPVTRARVSYDQLRESVTGERVQFARLVRPGSASEAVVALLRALALGQELTLFDSDLGDQELRNLGFSPERLTELVEVPGLSDEGPLPLAADAGSRFRLTLHTSGTTGLPKTVTHGIEGLTRTLRTSASHASSVWGLAYSPTHIAGVQVVLQAFFNQNSLINLFRAPREICLRTIAEFSLTHLSATPSFYRALLPCAASFPGLRAIALGGERSDAALLARLRDLFPLAKIRNFYASTEAGTILVAEGDTFAIPQELVDRVRLRDGQLEIHRALLGEFAAGAETVGADMWYRTGDVVEVLAEDPLRFRFLSRERDWVNVGGHKVNPAEVEEVLLTCPGVREARVYGRANSVLGQILCAEVVATGEFHEPQARAWLGERLQEAKIPRFIKVVPELARTRTGKVSRA